MQPALGNWQHSSVVGPLLNVEDGCFKVLRFGHKSGGRGSFGLGGRQ